MTSADVPPPLRVYTCYIDDTLHTETFAHGEMMGSELDRELDRRFQEWLEMTAPGAFDAGRVNGIRFADMVE